MGAYGRVKAHFYNLNLQRLYDDGGVLSTVSGDGEIYPIKANSKRKHKRIGSGAIYIPPTDIAQFPLIQVGHICIAFQSHIVNAEERYVAYFVIKTVQIRVVDKVPLYEVSGPEITKELQEWLLWDDIGEQQSGHTNIAIAKSAGSTHVDVDEAFDKYEDNWRIDIKDTPFKVLHRGTVSNVDIDGPGGGGSERVTFDPPLWNDVEVGDFVNFTDYSNPAADDIDQIMNEVNANLSWALTVEGYPTSPTSKGTLAGTSHVAIGQSTFDLLNEAAAITGEWWRIKARATADAAPTRHLEWRSTNDSSGVKLVMPAQADAQTRAGDAAYGIIEKFTREYEDARVSHVIPVGGGSGNEQVTLADATTAASAGFTLTINQWSGYAVLRKDSVATDLSPAHRYQKASFSNIVSKGSTDVNLQHAANLLLAAAEGWLNDRDEENRFYHCECVVNKNLEVGQTIELYYSDHLFTIDATATGDGALYITEIHVEVGDDNIRTFNLVLGEKLKTRVSGVDAMVGRSSGNTSAVGVINVGSATGGGTVSHPAANVVSSTPVGSLAVDGNQGFTLLIDSGDGLAATGTTIDVDLSTDSGLQFDTTELEMGTPTTLTAATGNAVSGAGHSHAITTTDDARTNPSTILAGDGDGRIRTDGIRIGNVTAASDHLVLDTLVDAQGEGYVAAGASAFTSEWKIDTSIGAAYFAYLEADQMHIRLFQADVTMAKANGMIVTDSVGVIHTDFTVPAVSSTVGIIVDDNPALGTAQVFQEDDWVRMRVFERSSGLDLFELWGQVSSYSDNGDGTQDWTLTVRDAGVGSGAVGLTVQAGAPILGYGISGQGWWEVDARRQQGPFTRIGTWAGSDPYTAANRSINLMTGRLLSLTGNDEYGLFVGQHGINGPHVLISDRTTEFQDISISMLEGTTDGGYIYIYALELNSDVTTAIAPNGDSTITNVVKAGTSHTNYYEYIDDNPASGQPDADYIHNTTGESASAWFDLEDIDDALTTLEIEAYVTHSSFVDDTCQLRAQIWTNDKTTPMTDEVKVASESTTSGLVTVQFTGVVEGFSQVNWNAARLKLTWTYFVTGADEILTIDPTEGINIVIDDSASYSDGRALTFAKSTGVEVGGIYGRFLSGAGGNYLKFVIGEDVDGDAITGLGNALMDINANGDYDEGGIVQIRAMQENSGGTGTESIARLRLSSGTGASAESSITLYTENVHISNVAGTGGGLVVGTTAYLPDLGQLILAQGAGDGTIISARSTDVTGMVTQGMDDDDTYFQVKKADADLGGATVKGAGESNYGMWLVGSANVADATEATTSKAPVILRAQVDSAAVGSGNNAIAMQDYTTTRWIMKDTGEVYNDYSTSMTAFPDTENDMALISTIADTLEGDILKTEWDDFVTYNREDLARLDIVTKTGFVNQHNITKLFIGAFRQLNGRIAELEAQIGKLN